MCCARNTRPVLPPHLAYSLTPMGIEVTQHVEGLADRIEGNLPRILRVRRERADALAGAAPRAGVRHGVSTAA